MSMGRAANNGRTTTLKRSANLRSPSLRSSALARIARVPVYLARRLHHDCQHNEERDCAHEQCVILLPQSTFMASSPGVSFDQKSVGQRGQQTGLTLAGRLALNKGEWEGEGRFRARAFDPSP